MNIRACTDDRFERKANFAASTWNAEAREFEVIFATDKTGVTRYDAQGPYTEFLDMGGFTIADNVPFLDNHNRASIDDSLGAVQSTRVVGREARAVIKLSRNHPSAMRMGADMEDGFKFPISTGYTVQKWKVTSDQKTGARTKTATRWTVFEISAVLIPADPHATTRGLEMDPENQPAVTPPAVTPPAVSPPAVTNDTQNRAAANLEIRTLATSLQLPQSWVDQQIDRQASGEQARAAALDEMLQRSQRGNVHPTVRIGEDFTDPEFRARTLGEALYSRINPSHNPAEAAQQYRGFSMLEIAADCLRTRGVAHAGISPARLVERALHTTSDFPLILGDATNRSVLDSYRVAQSALKAAARQVNARDFRTRHRLKLSEGPELEKVGQGGEIKAGTLVEAEESYKLDTYARRIGLSRQVIVNDDLGAFADISRRMGQGAAATEAKLLAKLIEDNGKLSDGKAVFHADHSNLASVGNSPWVTGAPGFMQIVSDARTNMRRQKTLQGNPMQVVPKFLVVPPEGETAAEQLLADIAAATINDANPFAGRLQLLVESYFKNARAWYLAADPALSPGIEWSYLEGEEGPQIETRAGWEIEGVEIKVRLDFGAGFVDAAGWYKNQGTAP